MRAMPQGQPVQRKPLSFRRRNMTRLHPSPHLLLPFEHLSSQAMVAVLPYYLLRLLACSLLTPQHFPPHIAVVLLYHPYPPSHPPRQIHLSLLKILQPLISSVKHSTPLLQTSLNGNPPFNDFSSETHHELTSLPWHLPFSTSPPMQSPQTVQSSVSSESLSQSQIVRPSCDLS